MSVQAAIAAALLQPGSPCPAGLRAWNGSDPAPRFAVYRNNVMVSLIDALAEAFPVCAELVGPEFFRAMAKEYVAASPPRSRVLAWYGHDFPAFIERFAPAQSVPYLADVARLERARVAAYHAADIAPVATGELTEALAAPELLARRQVVCHPSVTVVRSAFAVASLWAAHQGVGDLGKVDPYQREDALIVRVDLAVQVLRLPGGGAVFVQSLIAGHPLGEAIATAYGEAPEFDLSAMLTLLARSGAITRLKVRRQP